MEESIRIVLEAVQRAKGEIDSTLASINKLNASNKASESSFARVNRVFKENTKLLRDLGIAAGVAGAALAVLLKQTINTADAMGKQAKAVNSTVEAYSRLAVAADLNEVSQQELFLGLNQLNRAMVQSQDAGSKEAAIFKELGVATTDANGQIRSATDVLLEVSDAFAKSEAAATEAAFAQELFGRGGKDFLTFLNQGSAAIRATASEADKLGAVFTQKTAAGADEFNDNLSLLQVALRGIGNEIITQILPSLINFTNLILQVAKDGTTLRDVAALIVAILRTLAQVTIVVVGVFRVLGVVIGQVVGTAIELAKKQITGLVEVVQSVPMGLKALSSAFKKNFTDIGGTVADTGKNIVADIQKITEESQKLLKSVSSEEVTVPGAATPAPTAAPAERRDLKAVVQQQPGAEEGAAARALQAQAELEEFKANQELKFLEFRNVQAQMEEVHRLSLEAQAAEEASAIAELNAKNLTDATQYQNELTAIAATGSLKRLQIDKQYSDSQAAIRAKALEGTRQALENGATFAKAMGEKGFAAYKTLSIGVAIIDTYKSATAAYSAMAGIPYVGPILGIAAAAAAVAAGLANVAQIRSQTFAEGGLVPGAPSATDNRLATVATGEYIFDSRSVSRAGPGFFAELHDAIRGGRFAGFAHGGMVPRPNVGSSFQSGGFVGRTQLEAPGIDPDNAGSVSFAVTDTRNQMRQFQKKEGVKLMVDLLQRRSSRVFA